MKYQVIMFAPDRWGELEKFSKFYSSTYQFDHHTGNALSGATNHFHKVMTLFDFAQRIKANLEEDNKEISQHGYTPAIRGKELSAIIETIFLDLYSSIDCTRQVINFIFKNYTGVPKSTRKLFENALKDKIDKRVPESIRMALKNATWYDEFRKIRDELTHSDIGTCHLDKNTGKVFYMHSGLGTVSKASIIEDIFEKLSSLIKDVNVFLEQVYHSLNSQLSDKEVWQVCGIFDGRIYSRFVKSSEAKDFNSGRCEAFQWFEKDENPTCPFVDNCGAYKNLRC